MTRATLALLRGDLAAATALQPLAVVVCPLLCGALLFAIARYVVAGEVQLQKWRGEVILIVVLLALTAVWAARWFGAFGGPVAV